MEVLRCSIAALCAAAGMAAQAADLSDGELAGLLRGGGLTVYLRHAATERSQQDTQGRDYNDCSKQRNLSSAGREESRAIGEAIRAARLPIGEVVASPYCRALDTALLIFGKAERSTAVLPHVGADGKPGYSQLLRLVSTPPAPGTVRVVVGHNVPEIARLEEGEAAVVRPLGERFEVLAVVAARRWRAFAR